MNAIRSCLAIDDVVGVRGDAFAVEVRQVSVFHAKARGWPPGFTYGYRSAPYGIRSRLSGATAAHVGRGDVLRDDGGCWDLAIAHRQRPDGKLVTIYYFNDDPEPRALHRRTIWDPGGKERLGRETMIRAS